jgi:hypothetical protein
MLDFLFVASHALLQVMWASHVGRTDELQNLCKFKIAIRDCKSRDGEIPECKDNDGKIHDCKLALVNPSISKTSGAE